MFTTQRVLLYILHNDISKPATFLLQALTDLMELCALGVTPMEMNDFCDKYILNTQALRERCG